jgi:hypothetical protein
VFEVTDHWRPEQRSKRLHTQIAFSTERIHFRFRWDQPNPGGWIHDMLVYHEGEWTQFANPSPWIASGDHPEHTPVSTKTASVSCLTTAQ